MNNETKLFTYQLVRNLLAQANLKLEDEETVLRLKGPSSIKDILQSKRYWRSKANNELKEIL
jgi:hypothetical protein